MNILIKNFSKAGCLIYQSAGRWWTPLTNRFLWSECDYLNLFQFMDFSSLQDFTNPRILNAVKVGFVVCKGVFVAYIFYCTNQYAFIWHIWYDPYFCCKWNHSTVNWRQTLTDGLLVLFEVFMFFKIICRFLKLCFGIVPVTDFFLKLSSYFHQNC